MMRTFERNKMIHLVPHHELCRREELKVLGTKSCPVVGKSQRFDGRRPCACRVRDATLLQCAFYFHLQEYGRLNTRIRGRRRVAAGRVR